jgi:gliding motility-associated-like protein
MRKRLFSQNTTLRILFLTAVLFCMNKTINAQCGIALFNEAGTLTPTATWTNVSVGSGTYTNFNALPGRIYSFNYVTNSAVLPYVWDLTLSTSSGVLPYDNSLTPVRDPWTGGDCPPVIRPESSEWWSGTFNGLIAANTHAYNTSNSTCNAWVPGQGSAILSYKECIPSADPGFGSNAWNVEAFATTNIAIPIPDARYGVYTDNGLSFVTSSSYATSSSPSSAPTWVGCEVPNDNFTIRARRTGFPCGLYTISDNAHDDNLQIYVNGTLIYNVAGGAPAGVIGSYVLSSTDNVEVRLVDVCLSGVADIGVNLQSLPALGGGVIGGVADNSSICDGSAIGNFTDVSGATGGTVGFSNGGAYTYDWELSTDGGATYNPVGVSTSTWNSATTVPVGSTYVIRRKVTDRCGSISYSNTISVIGRAIPNASMAPTSQTICPGTSASITIDLNPGTGPFNIGYTDGVSNFSATGLNTGDAVSVSPTLSPTIYSFTTLTDFYGCTRTTGFTSGASVTIVPNITYNSVTSTEVLCNGGNTGTITVNAQGGNGGLTYSVDSGVTYQSSNIFTGLVVGTYYVFVQDNFGCIQPYGTPVVIGSPTDVTQTLAGTDASCANVFDGSITVTANGGISPYNYSLNGGPVQPGNVFNGIGAGNYVVSVYDSNGCLDTSSIVIGNSYIISVAIDSQADVSCIGAADGSFTVHVNGGIPAYSYSINGVTYQPSGTFTGLSAGTYIVIGRDSKGCTETVNVTIAPPTAIVVATDSVHNVLCNGTATGDIFISVTGGTPGYTFNWNNGLTSEDITGVVAGSYTVTVADSRGCLSTGSATITEPLPLFLNIASYNDLLCSGDSSGAIDVTANGGVPAYSYLWSNGETSEDIDELKLGTFTVTVTDNNGCTVSISQVISEPTPLVISVTSVDVNCFSGSNGSIDVTVTGGTPSYSFLWSTFETSEDIANLQAGVYNVIVSDNNGCQQNQSVTINQPTQLVLSTVVTQISCFNTCDGSIDLTVTGGTPTYTYNWSNGETTEDIGSLCGATYVVTVTDGNTCSATTSATIVATAPINTSFIIKNPLCFGEANGSIDLIPSGGTFPYTFNWSNGFTTEDLANIGDGVYIVTITDSRNCVKVDSTELVEPSAIYTSGFIKNVSCNGDNDGFIDITAYGGTLPYGFNWSWGPSTEDLGNLPGGNYTVTVTDVNGCQAASLYVVAEPTVLGVQAVGTDISCFGGNNGTVAAIPTGGTTPYEYLWSNFIPDSSQIGLFAGKYIVLLTDSNGCHTYDSVTIIEPSEISITGVVTNVFCNGFNTGSIVVTVGGGTPGYTFSWSNGETTQSIANLIAGVYGLTVTDNRGCIKTASFVVSESNGMFTNVSIHAPKCFGGNDAFVSVEVTGGTPPYVYTWNTNPSQPGATATNLQAGVYELTITDVNSCSATVSATVASPNPITISTNPSNSKCYNTSTGVVVATATGGQPPYIYELNGVIQSSNTFNGLGVGTYIIAVRDANGCEATQNFDILSPVPVTVDLVAPQIVILQGMTVPLIATASSPNSPIVNYIWEPGADSIFNFDNCADATNCFNPNVTPQYTTVFTVTVMNADSCYASDTATIVVESKQSAFVPSAFTPNGDGLNDRFEFDILGATNISIQIFDRWGHKIYDNPTQPNGITGVNGWDGKNEGKVLPYDTYVWQMKVTYFDGRVKDQSGTVTIMK